jgi:5-methylcytosine-specific restriction endonuclease McrA
MKALKLDASYRPIEVIDALEALVLCLMDKAAAIENYTRDVRSATQKFKLPSVIVLKKIVKFKLTGLACNRANVLWRDKHKCQYCNVHHDDRQLTLDHVIPKSRGGQNSWTNIVTACKDCNQKKGNKTPAEANMRLYRQPIKPKTSLLNYSKISNVNEIWKNYLWEFK